jgi:hypothetical protein
MADIKQPRTGALTGAVVLREEATEQEIAAAVRDLRERGTLLMHRCQQILDSTKVHHYRCCCGCLCWSVFALGSAH